MTLTSVPQIASEPAMMLSLREFYAQTRLQSEALIESLSAEDCQLQSMPDASPAKWHLAHTSWFFETFILSQKIAAYQTFNPHYRVLFNSYYNGIGEQFKRPQRGLLSRPSLAEVLAYRQHVDQHMLSLLEQEEPDQELSDFTVLGIHHEKQHQELLLMDIKHAFSINPMAPAYYTPTNSDTLAVVADSKPAQALSWLHFDAGLYTLGAAAEEFSFDNERPRHQRYVYPFKLASRPTNNAEYLAFIEDGGYQDPQHWLADGWAYLQQQQLSAPLYWRQIEGTWHEFSLAGLRALQPEQPVCHLSFYEAQAFAQWSNKRLPSEAEWEIACTSAQAEARSNAHYLSQHSLHPQAADTAADDFASKPLKQMLGSVWEWTSSDYAAYPNFEPLAGVAGEYNGKFMSNQYVLRGGSCLSPQRHIRASYRNFFYPHQAWMMSGVRLAEDSK